MVEIAIIGTAGRGEDGPRLTSALYAPAVDAVEGLLADVPVHERAFRSGGAAWMDHIAVVLFIRGEAESLDLHLPSPLAVEGVGFADNGDLDWRRNPGRVTNRYHVAFAKRCGDPSGLSSFRQLRLAVARGARVHVHDGFHARNLVVGQVARLVALTFGVGDVPKADSGTLHTWEHSPAPWRRHVDLGLLQPGSTP